MQLAPDLVAQGTYPADFPYMPRMLMRNAHLQGQDCLDLGSMEGVIPVLMHRKGAKRIIAADAVPHCAEKMDLLQKVYGGQLGLPRGRPDVRPVAKAGGRWHV